MAQNVPTSFQDASAVSARSAEAPNADFAGGMNNGASNACGVGINLEGGAVVGEAQQFTLLDQYGAVRVPQDSMHIGKTGLGDGASGVADVPIDGAINNVDGDGTITKDGTANLQTLSAGWVRVAV